jgi:hypothetical protein
MDSYCIELGYLLDNPTVDPLIGPDQHTIHWYVSRVECSNQRESLYREASFGCTHTHRCWLAHSYIYIYFLPVKLDDATTYVSNALRCFRDSSPSTHTAWWMFSRAGNRST